MRKAGTHPFHRLQNLCKKMLREQRIPFDVSIDNFYSENNIRYLEKVVAEIDSGSAPLVEHSLIEEELMTSIESSTRKLTV